MTRRSAASIAILTVSMEKLSVTSVENLLPILKTPTITSEDSIPITGVKKRLIKWWCWNRIRRNNEPNICKINQHIKQLVQCTWRKCRSEQMKPFWGLRSFRSKMMNATFQKSKLKLSHYSSYDFVIAFENDSSALWVCNPVRQQVRLTYTFT